MTSVSPSGERGLLAILEALRSDPSSEVHWHRLVTELQPYVQHYVRNSLRSGAGGEMSSASAALGPSVEDLCQEVWMRFIRDDFRGLRSFEGTTEAAFILYLKVTSGRVVLDSLRYEGRKRRRGRHVTESSDLPEGVDFDSLLADVGRGASASPEERVVLKEYEEFVWTELDSVFSGRDRELNSVLFLLSWIYDLTAEDLARVPGVKKSPAAIYKMLQRAKGKYRELYARRDARG